MYLNSDSDFKTSGVAYTSHFSKLRAAGGKVSCCLGRLLVLQGNVKEMRRCSKVRHKSLISGMPADETRSWEDRMQQQPMNRFEP